MNRLIYVDAFSHGTTHETFNASSLKMFSEIYDEIDYYATCGSQRCVEKIAGVFPANIRRHSIYLSPKMKGSLGAFMEGIVSNLWALLMLLRAPCHSTLFYNANPLWAMSQINRIARYRKIKVVIMCHGELGFLISGTRLNKLSQTALNLFRSKKFVIANNLYFCVASKTILNNVKKVFAQQVADKFISFEHTFIPQKVTTEKAIINSKFKIGTVGTLSNTSDKIKQILKLGEALKNRPDIEVYTLGRVICDTALLDKFEVKYIPGTEIKHIPKEELNRYIDSMDCLVFMYPMDMYRFTASGALCDALDREKIILSLHNDYFDKIFSRVNVGKQFDTMDELIRFICTFNKSTLKDLDFKECKRLLSPEYEATQCRTTFLNL